MIPVNLVCFVFISSNIGQDKTNKKSSKQRTTPPPPPPPPRLRLDPEELYERRLIIH